MFGPDAPLPSSVKTDSGWLDRVNEGSHQPHSRGDRSPRAALRRQPGRSSTTRSDFSGSTWRALGVWDRTVLVITADHGEAMYEHGFIGHNEQVYEESVRIPLILRFPPGTVPGGRRVDSLTGLLDVAPTIADVLGIPKERTPTFRGRSLLPGRRRRTGHAAGGGAVPHGGLPAALRVGRRALQVPPQHARRRRADVRPGARSRRAHRRPRVRSRCRRPTAASASSPPCSPCPAGRARARPAGRCRPTSASRCARWVTCSRNSRLVRRPAPTP